MKIHVPVELELPADLLRAESSAALAAQVAEVVRQQLVAMAAQVSADGFHGDAVVRGPELAWTGVDLDSVPRNERALAGARLVHALTAMGRAFAASHPHAIAPAGDWRIERFEFAAHFGEVLALLDEFPWNHPGAMRARFDDHWTDTVHGVAWVVTVQRPVSWGRVHGEINAERKQSFEGETLWGYFWDRVRAERLRELDPRHLAGLPRLAEAEMTAPRSADGAALLQLAVGTRVIFVAAKLPVSATDGLVELGRSFTVQVELHDAFITSDGVLDVPRLQRLYGLSEQDLVNLLEYYPEVELDVWVLPFAVKRATPDGSLRDALVDEAHRQHAPASELGQLRPLGAAARHALPSAVTEAVLPLAHGHTDPPDHVSPPAYWQPGWAGAYLRPVIDRDELRNRAYFASRWLEFDEQARHVIELLARSNGVLWADRYRAIWQWTADWEKARPEAFDLVLYAVDRRGALDRLFDAWIEEKLYPSRLRALIRLCLRSRYARHPKVLAIIARIEQWETQQTKHAYDVDHQQIRLFYSDEPSHWITAAGASTDPKAGVVAETRSYYAKQSNIKRLTKAALKQASKPVLDRLGPLMAKMVCEGKDAMSGEELVAQAAHEAREELHFTDKDYEPTTLRLSLRVLRLEHRQTAGVTDVVVHWVPVTQIGDDPWAVSGKLASGSPVAFEAMLTSYHVDHLVDWVLAPIALTGAILLTGGAALAAGVTVGGLVVAIGLSELFYVITTDHVTLNGILMAAWVGTLEALGFKGLSSLFGLSGKLAVDLASKLFVRAALVMGSEVGAEALTVRLLSTRAIKWILFALRGGVAGVEAGSVAVLGLLAQDLFQMTACNGMSSREEYWNRFKTGFIVGAALELVAIPLLTPLLRPVLHKASTLLEAAQILNKSGKSFSEIARTLLRGGSEMEEALGRALGKSDTANQLALSFRQKIWKLLQVYGREYESRAYGNLLALLGDELDARASKTLARLVEHHSEKELDQLLARLARDKQLRIIEMLDLLADLDDASLKMLLQRGGIAQLAESPNVLGLLRGSPQRGWRLLGQVFGFAVHDCETYIGRFANAPATSFDHALEILFRPSNTLPADLVADAVLRFGALSPAEVTGLQRMLIASRIPVARPGDFPLFVRTHSPPRVHQLITFADAAQHKPNEFLNSTYLLFEEGATNPVADRIATKVMANPDFPGIDSWIKLAGRQRRSVPQLLDLELSLDDAVAQRLHDPTTRLEVWFQNGQELPGPPPGNPPGAGNVDVVTATARREWKRVNVPIRNEEVLLGQIKNARKKFKEIGIRRNAGGKENIGLVDLGAQLDAGGMSEADALQYIQSFMNEQDTRDYLDVLIVSIKGVVHMFRS